MNTAFIGQRVGGDKGAVGAAKQQDERVDQGPECCRIRSASHQNPADPTGTIEYVLFIHS